MKKILSIVFLLLLALNFSACNNNPSSKTSSSAASSEQKSSSSTSTSMHKIDIVATCKLTESFDGKTFLKDGIEEVTLNKTVDGDTIHVNLHDGQVISLRFLAVDTPESTGQVQPWGHKASAFTSGKVLNAKSIVIESDVTGEGALPDSTGSRFLAWVWYKTDDNSEYRNLNLELIQDGYSQTKGATDVKYASYCQAAFSQALKLAENINSDDEDPDFYYGDAIILSLKTLRDDIENYAGKKVSFEAVVTKIDGYNVYVQYTDPETNDKYGIMIFTAYNNIPIFQYGNLVRITGNVEKYNDSYQITNITYFAWATDDLDNLKLISQGNPSDPEVVTIPDVDIKTNASIENVYVKLENLTVQSIYTTTSGTSAGAMTLTCVDENGHTIKVRTTVLEENGLIVTQDKYANKTIDVQGLVEQYNGAFQVKVIYVGDIVIK